MKKPISYSDAQIEQFRTGAILFDEQENGDYLETVPVNELTDAEIREATEEIWNVNQPTPLDEQAGCKITELKEQPMSTRDKLIAMLDDNEAWERIALEACLEQQKVIDKAKVIEAAKKSIGITMEVCLENSVIRRLYDAGFLSMTEGDK